MYISAETGGFFGTRYRNAVQVDRIGNSGGELGNGFNQFETPLTIVPEAENSITFGIYFQRDCGWTNADNFELYYYGAPEHAIEFIKSELTALKDSSDMPSGYDFTDIETLLSTELSSENEISLSVDLYKEIKTLKEAIAENRDNSLSDLKVDSATLRTFSPSVYDYQYNIYYSSSETQEVPTVTATNNSSNAEPPVIEEATTIPGTTYIKVKAGNDSVKTYAVNFVPITLEPVENLTTTVDTYKNKTVELSGIGQLTITGDLSTDPILGSRINIISPDSWIYFSNIKPSQVSNALLLDINVNGERAVVNTNIRVAQYLNGAMVIPHADTYKALTVHSGPSLGGSSADILINNRYNSELLGDLNDNIESFILKKGYMATFSTNADGTGLSRVYIAKDNDIIVNIMPKGVV